MSGLRIVYGERLDGVAWPPSPESKSLGFAAVGPAGFLALVETFVGLSGPPVPAARRIAPHAAAARGIDGPPALLVDELCDRSMGRRP